MFEILSQWGGTFEIDGERYDSLDDVPQLQGLRTGDSFHIRLIPETNDAEE